MKEQPGWTSLRGWRLSAVLPPFGSLAGVKRTRQRSVSLKGRFDSPVCSSESELLICRIERSLPVCHQGFQLEEPIVQRECGGSRLANAIRLVPSLMKLCCLSAGFRRRDHQQSRPPGVVSVAVSVAVCIERQANMPRRGCGASTPACPSLPWGGPHHVQHVAAPRSGRANKTSQT